MKLLKSFTLSAFVRWHEGADSDHWHECLSLKHFQFFPVVGNQCCSIFYQDASHRSTSKNCIRVVPHLKDAPNTTFSLVHNVEHRHWTVFIHSGFRWWEWEKKQNKTKPWTPQGFSTTSIKGNINLIPKLGFYFIIFLSLQQTKKANRIYTHSVPVMPAKNLHLQKMLEFKWSTNIRTVFGSGIFSYFLTILKVDSKKDN